MLASRKEDAFSCGPQCKHFGSVQFLCHIERTPILIAVPVALFGYENWCFSERLLNGKIILRDPVCEERDFFFS